MSPRTVLFTADEIQARLSAMARSLAAAAPPAEILAPVLNGAFVFAADLSRALSREGLDLPLEFLRLRSYGDTRRGGEIAVLAGPSDAVRGRRVLLIDAVLDHGRTLVAARDLLLGAGAVSVTTAVVVDKCRAGAPLRADHACFSGVRDFIVGYGMDDACRARGLPDIAKAD